MDAAETGTKSAVANDLKSKLALRVPELRARERQILEKFGDRKLAEVTVRQAFGGMRGVRCMVTETSSVDPEEGIRFRGHSIPELQRLLPRAPGGEQPLPEGVFHLLLTGQIPAAEEVDEISRAWRREEALPRYVTAMLDPMPLDTHPMTQFSLGILMMQHDSIFARRYREGMPRSEQWSAMFDDAMVLLGRLPLLAAYVYRRSYKAGQHIAPDPDLDWGGNLAHMLGVESDEFKDLMRLYLSIHADHEGGNVSAHTTHLVGSTLADPWLCLSAGMNGLAGPLHGLANQEVVRWILELKEQIGREPDPEQVELYVRDTLAAGRVIPGYGHAVLRRTDPRYTAQREFALAHLPDDENFKIVRMLYEIVPRVLQEQGKAKNPWPNVDAHSGCLLMHYGIQEYDFYTVLFGVSRAMGVMASLIIDRIEAMPLERPKSVTSDWIESTMNANGG